MIKCDQKKKKKKKKRESEREEYEALKIKGQVEKDKFSKMDK